MEANRHDVPQLRIPPGRLALAAWLLVLSWAAGCAGLGGGPATPPGASPAEAAKHWEQAMALRQTGDYARAAQEFELAVQADPDMYHAWYMLGHTYQTMGQNDLARRAYQSGLMRAQTGPERQDYPRQQAITQLEMGLASLDQAAAPAPAPTPAPVPKSAPAKAKSGDGKGGWAVLFSSNLKADNAKRDQAMLAAKGYKAKVQTATVKGKTWHRVVVACCASKEAAQKTLAEIRKKGLGRDLSLIRP